MIRILTFTNLYPDSRRPRHGVFVEQRLLKLVSSGRVEARVVCPVPWCPLPLDKSFPQYRIRNIPFKEVRKGIVIYRPRYWVVPGLTSYINPWSMARAGISVIRKILKKEFNFDVIDAQFIYPDGIAGALIAKKISKPITLTARGSDVNVALREFIPKKWFCLVMERVEAFISVSLALQKGLVEVGVDPLRIHVIRNGVDLEIFKDRDRLQLKKRLGFHNQTILSVGNLVEEKGHHLVIQAIAKLPQIQLVVIGSGAQLSFLKEEAVKLRVADRIRWVAHVDQSELADYYSAAEVTVLASSREGMPNVLLESLACGTPVVATNVGGSAEIVVDDSAGILIDERSDVAIASAIKNLLDDPLERAVTRAYAQRFSWREPIAQQLSLLERIVAEHQVLKAIK